MAHERIVEADLFRIRETIDGPEVLEGIYSAILHSETDLGYSRYIDPQNMTGKPHDQARRVDLVDALQVDRSLDCAVVASRPITQGCFTVPGGRSVAESLRAFRTLSWGETSEERIALIALIANSSFEIMEFEPGIHAEAAEISSATCTRDQKRVVVGHQAKLLCLGEGDAAIYLATGYRQENTQYALTYEGGYLDCSELRDSGPGDHSYDREPRDPRPPVDKLSAYALV